MKWGHRASIARRMQAATPESIPRLPLEPKHRVEANLEVATSDQREVADAIFTIGAGAEVWGAKLDDAASSRASQRDTYNSFEFTTKASPQRHGTWALMGLRPTPV